MSIDATPTIVHVVSSLEGGGTERTLVALLRSFDAQRYRHVVVTLRGAGHLTERLPDHVALRPLDRTGRSRTSGLALARETRRRGTALIHARNTGCWNDAIVAGLLNRRTRLVLGFHGLETSAGFGRRQRRSARWALRAGARFTAVSLAGQRQLHDEASIPQDRVTVLPNGVDRQRFQPAKPALRAQVRTEWGFRPDDFVVGIVGSLTPVKGHAMLIQAIATAAQTLPNLRLLIVGDGSLRESLVHQAQGDGVAGHVRFAGWSENVADIMTGMDAYACSSESEGMSNAILEAMACGLPIVATDVGDNAAVVRHDLDGQIVPPRAPDSMARALILLASTPTLYRKYSREGQLRAKSFDFDSAVSAYEAYYRSLIEV